MIKRELLFSPAAASVDAIQRAGYRLSDRLSLELAETTSDEFRCSLFVEAADAEQADAVVHEFRKEVLDQVLRERIRAETSEVRNLILSLAFSRTGLVPQD